MKIGDRGQITIPKRIRQRYGLLPHTEVSVVEMQGMVVVVPARKAGKDRWGKATGILRERVADVDAYMRETRGS